MIIQYKLLMLIQQFWISKRQQQQKQQEDSMGYVLLLPSLTDEVKHFFLYGMIMVGNLQFVTYVFAFRDEKKGVR